MAGAPEPGRGPKLAEHVVEGHGLQVAVVDDVEQLGVAVGDGGQVGVGDHDLFGAETISRRCRVRTRLLGRPAPPPTPTRRQVALRRGVLDDQRPSSLPVAGRRPGRHVLDILVQPRRDAKAAKRFFRNLPTKHCQVPRVLVTDKLRSYQAAHRAVMPSVKHRQSRYLNNPGGELAPADPPTRTRHETIPHPRLSPTVPGGVQRDLPAFPARRHRLTADDYRTAMTDRFATWNDITRSSKAA